MSDTPRTDAVFDQFPVVLHPAAMAYMSLCRELEREITALRNSLPKRPEKGALVVDIFYSHGDWSEPHKFGNGYSLRIGLNEMRRDSLREFSATIAEHFHEQLSAAFFLVGDSEQAKREIKWQADIGVPFPPRDEIIITKGKTP